MSRYLCSLLSDSSWIWERSLAPILTWNRRSRRRIECQLITGAWKRRRETVSRGNSYRGDRRHLSVCQSVSGADRRHRGAHTDSWVEISYLYQLRNATPGHCLLLFCLDFPRWSNLINLQGSVPSSVTPEALSWYFCYLSYRSEETKFTSCSFVEGSKWI